VLVIVVCFFFLFELSVFVFFDGQHGFRQGLLAVCRVLCRLRTVIHAEYLVSHVFGAVVAIDHRHDGRVCVGVECK
jgi:hypothetical protein